VASIRKRDGRWRAQVRKRGYKPQFGSFTQKSEAIAWARQLESEMDRGVFVSRHEAERTTPGELFDRYQTERAPNVLAWLRGRKAPRPRV
jgi:hypothetical protein